MMIGPYNAIICSGTVESNLNKYTNANPKRLIKKNHE
jgi:hypothetical protein